MQEDLRLRRARSGLQVRSFALAIALAIAAPSCALFEPPPTPVRPHYEPAWQDIFDGTPSFFAVIRPQAMKRDPVYGKFFDVLLRVAQARAETNGVTAIEALAGSDEIIVGITRHEDRHDDVAIVFRGVPASLDPAKMTNAEGTLVLSAADEHSRVPEYELTDQHLFGSIFVLPERTWVLTMGTARDRAKQAFASPKGKPLPQVDATALAVLRVDANVFGRRRSEGITTSLQSATITLAPGKDGLRLALSYEDENATKRAEPQVKQLVAALMRDKPERFNWLEGAKITREGKDVKASVAPPARLLEELPNVNAKDL